MIFEKAAVYRRKETKVKRKQTKDTVERFNNMARQSGHTYAEEQRQETLRSMGRIRAPKGEDGETVYMKVSARNSLRNIGKAADGRK